MNAIEIAIKMETDAINFYKDASSKVKNKVGTKMFLSIVEDEKRHLQMLSEILKGLDINIRDVSPMKNIKTIFEELRDEMMERIAATEDELDAFKIAMDMEKEGIEFYKKASEASSDKEKALFERLIKEEEQHYAMFANTYFFMKDSGSWFMWEEHSIVDGGTPWA